jgi:glycerol uptake facilitator-like aquaporin
MPPRNLPTIIEFRGRQLIIWEDVDNKFLRACLAEFMAMHLFVLLCCGCAMVTLNIPNPNLMMVAASFGFGILTLAQIFGPLSGGHINSAVSLGLFIAGRTSLVKTVCYTLSQMLGSVFGALFLWAIFGSNWPAARAFGSNSWDTSVFTGGQVFFAEMLGTALLMFNVLSTIDIPSEGGGPLGVYPIAMSVMVAHLFLLPIDGCSINPTRSFGPSLVAQWAGIPGTYVDQQAMFWFAPMFGAAVAAFFYEYGTLKPENFAGAKDMDTAIFQAGKAKRKVKGNKGRLSSSVPNQNAGNNGDNTAANAEYNPVHRRDDDEVYAPQYQQPSSRQTNNNFNSNNGRNDNRPAAVVTTGGYDGFEEEDLADYT